MPQLSSKLTFPANPALKLIDASSANRLGGASIHCPDAVTLDAWRTAEAQNVVDGLPIWAPKQWVVVATDPPGMIREWDGTSAFVTRLLGGIADILDLTTLAGVTLGRGVSSAVRQANCTAINAALVTAAQNGQIALFAHGSIEIEGTNGIVIPNFCRFIGTPLAQFIQYTNGANVMTIGNPASSDSVNRIIVDGVWLRYGNTQVGQTTGAGLGGVRAWMCEFRNIDIGDVYTGPSETPAPSFIRNGILFSGSAPSFLFSCVFDNIRIRNFYNYGVYQNVQGTGNVWRNIMCSNGDSGTVPGQVDGGSALCGMRLGNSSSGAGVSETSLHQINFEWTEFTGTGSGALVLDTGRGVAASSIHIEGCAMGTNCTSFIKAYSGSTLDAQAVTIQDCGTTATNATPRGLISVGTASHVKIGRLRHEIGVFRTMFDATPLAIVRADAAATRNASCIIESYDPAAASGITTAQVTLLESTGTSLEFSNASSFAIRSRILKQFGMFLPLPEANDAGQTLGDASISMYSDWARDTFVAATLTTSRTITLATTLTDPVLSFLYGALPVPQGQKRSIFRAAGTGAQTLTIANGGPGGGNLTTLAAGEWADFMFNGTNWVVLRKGTGVG